MNDCGAGDAGAHATAGTDAVDLTADRVGDSDGAPCPVVETDVV